MAVGTGFASGYPNNYLIIPSLWRAYKIFVKGNAWRKDEIAVFFLCCRN